MIIIVLCARALTAQFIQLITSYISKCIFISCFGIFNHSFLSIVGMHINHLVVIIHQLFIIFYQSIAHLYYLQHLFFLFLFIFINYLYSITSFSQSTCFSFIINVKWHWCIIPKQIISSFIACTLTLWSSRDLCSLNTLW